MGKLNKSVYNLSLILFSFLFHFLFYNQGIGINLIIIEFVLLGILHYQQKLILKPFTLFLLTCWLLSCIAVLLNATFLGIVFNCILLFTLAALPIIQTNNYFELLGLSLLRLIPFPSEYTIESNINEPLQSKSRVSRILRIAIIPLLILILFFVFYANSIPGFLDLFQDILELFPSFSLQSILLIALGVVLSLFYWRRRQEGLPLWVAWLSKQDLRKQKHGNSKTLNRLLDLEYKRHLLTLSLLLVLITIAIFLDLKYLLSDNLSDSGYSQMQWAVRQGTMGLILSIIASIFLATFVFRGNLSFYREAKPLKILTYIWLALNFILCLSLLWRTLLYIDFYNLAYKRIAVMAFVGCALFGLLSVAYKIHKNKGTSFLIRVNINMIILTFTIFSIPNWDKIIVNYNMSHSQAFLDYDYLFTRDLNAVLPYMDDDNLKNRTIGNYKNYFWLKSRYGDISYHDFLLKRIKKEKEKNSKMDWRSWNFNRQELMQNIHPLEERDTEFREK